MNPVTVTPKTLDDPPLYLASAEPVEFVSGFYDREVDGQSEFRWMGAKGQLRFEPRSDDRYLELWVLSEFHDLSQVLTVAAGGRDRTFRLVWGWAPLAVEVPGGAEKLDLSVNKIFPQGYHPGDARVLAVRVRQPLLHRDQIRHQHITHQQSNAVHNVEEMLAGRPALESTPTSLGIDLYGVCNVKPPCVYCEWDHNKKAEGEFVDTPFTLDTLREWGPFFDNSTNLVNCSIGEPFMMKNFDDLLDAFGQSGKVLEMTTNGQILTDRNIQRLLGRPIDLYISLDAGTPGTYAKLRNDRFNAILKNLERLIEAKGGPGQRPRVYLVFMPMRVNVHELDKFVAICARLNVDRLVLRPLNYSDIISLDWERQGYRFEYQKELLPFEQLVRVSGRAAALCERDGVPLSDQMDFGGSMGAQFEQWFEEGRRSVEAAPVAETETVAESSPAVDEPPPAVAPPPVVAPQTAEPLPSLGGEKKPACTEPWKSLYILRRGVYPCCYGGEPLAPMDRYRDVWNSPRIQEIRSDLAEGKFHAYCLRSPACPIVRKSEQAKTLPIPPPAEIRPRRWRSSVGRIWQRITGARA